MLIFKCDSNYNVHVLVIVIFSYQRAKFYTNFKYIFTDSGIKYEVVAAIDVNTTANKIYRHNFKGTYLIENGIEVHVIQC